MDLDTSFEALMADARLVELCELHRAGDSIFDVIKLKEDQHSAMLAWMLDPKEGHGQGDEILRDLLVAASMTSSINEKLHANTASARFFAEWPPSRLRTASFASAFTARELSVTGEGRFDLFVVDAENEFVLVIENKAGTSHKRAQLDGYAAQTVAALTKNPRLKQYKKAFIALDSRFDPDQETPREADSHWVHLGYDWLETSAERAQRYVDRGNISARLVASYCQAVTDWELPRTRRIQQLASHLHRDYREAVQRLTDLDGKRAGLSWLKSRERERTAMVFGLQNKSVIRTFQQTSGMASVRMAVVEALGVLPENNIEDERRTLYVSPRNAVGLGKDDYWPVLIRARYVRGTESRFNVSVVWRAEQAVSSDIAAALRRILTGIDKRFATHPDAKWRSVVVRENVTLPTLLQVLADYETKISSALGKAQLLA